MTRHIFKISNPSQWNILTRQCETVEKFDRSLRRIVRDLIDTLYEAEGLGLAAPQIGLSVRVAVVDVISDPEKAGKPLVLINPVIVKHAGTQVADRKSVV